MVSAVPGTILGWRTAHLRRADSNSLLSLKKPPKDRRNHIDMVEGPGCTLKGEKLGPRAKGQVVKGVLGNAVDRVSSRGED